MSTFVIWGEADHRVRATGLAQAYGTTAAGIDAPAAQIAGLDKLVFWGHGTATHFCGKTPEQFVKTIKTWRTINKGLKTVEMLTCNARHSENGRESYTDQVVTALSRKANSRADKVNFRALPVCTTPSGKTCHYSILKWHPGSQTWAYIAAPKKDEINHWDNHMHDGVVKLEDFMVPRGAATDYPKAHAAFKASNGKLLTDPYAVRHNWNTDDFDTYNKDFKRIRDDTFIATGNLGLLRWFLTDIK